MLNLLKKALEVEDVEAKNILLQMAILELEEEEKKVTVGEKFNSFKSKLPKVSVEIPGREKKKA